MKKIFTLTLICLMITVNSWAAKITTYSYDDDLDGQTDRTKVESIDNQNRITSVSYDDDFDGQADRIESYTNTSTESHSEIRNATTNALLSSKTYTYDAARRTIFISFDNNGDGISDFSINRVYTGPGTGNRTDTYTRDGSVWRTDTIVTVEE